MSQYHGAFCRNPLHPGPCKGWRSRQRKTSVGSTQQIVKPVGEIGKPARGGKADTLVPASTMSEDWAAHTASLSPEQKAAAQAYVGTSYNSINPLLRGQLSQAEMEEFKPFYAKMAQFAQQVQDSMAPAPRGTLALRGMESDGLGLGSSPTREQIEGLVGSVLINDAFTSTTVDPSMVFSGDVRLRIEVPKGTPSLWLGDLGKESELLLAAGGKMRIDAVEVVGNGQQYVITGRMVP